MPEISNSSLTESPVGPDTDRTYRLAKATAIGLGVAILVAIAVIVYGISAGWGHKSVPVAAASAKAKDPIVWTLAPGYRILSSETQPGRLIIHVRSDTVDEILVINTDDGSRVAIIHGEAPAK